MDKLLEKYVAYNPDEDFSGALGGSLAEKCHKKYNTLKINDIVEEQKKWDVWSEIAFRNFAFCGPGEIITVREVKARLSELKKAQYPIDSGYRKLRKKALWSYFGKTKSKIRIHNEQ